MEEADSFVFCRRFGLCGVGIAVAWTQSQQHVFCRRNLLFAVGKVEQNNSPDATAAAGLYGRAGDYTSGAAGRTADKRGLFRLGLPAGAFEFFWADLFALFAFVDTGKPGGNVFV